MSKTPEQKLKDKLYELAKKKKVFRFWEQKIENTKSKLECWSFNDHVVIFQIWEDGGFTIYDDSTAPGNSLPETFDYLDLLLHKSQKDSWVPVEVLGREAVENARAIPRNLIKKQNAKKD